MTTSGDAATAVLAGQHAYAAVIGDVVGSRSAGPELFQRLDAALDQTNTFVPAEQPLQITIGDEFQGVYRALGQALNATLLVRLLLHDVTDLRFGVGWGSFTRWNAERAPYQQDGPAWWAAREALQTVARQEHGSGTPAGWRTAVQFGTESGPSDVDRKATGVPLPTAVAGMVMFRDHVLSGLDQRDVELVVALLEGSTVTEAAARVGISQQAASRRLRVNGGYALIHGWQLIGDE